MEKNQLNLYALQDFDMLHSNPMKGNEITPLIALIGDELVEECVHLLCLWCVQAWSLHNSQRDGWGLHLA